MNAALINNIASAIESFVTAAAILVGAGWAYWKFILQREAEPATDIDIDCDFIGTQDAKWIVQITATLANRSLVRLHYNDFQVTARYLLASDPVEDGDERVAYQLRMPRTIDERSDGAKRLFANSVYINPKQEFRHRYITHVPLEATFVWLQCKFFFTLANGIQKSNAQKVFKVPERTPQASA